MKTHVQLDDVWDKIIDHYYDNVHWTSERSSIYNWVKVKYGGEVDMEQRKIFFDDQTKSNWFALRWL